MMLEKELSTYVDKAFTKIGFKIENEVRYPHVRIDKEVTRGNRRYIMELETIKRFNWGVRQLQQVKQIRDPPNGYEYQKKDEKKFIHEYYPVLVVPEITHQMHDIPELFHIRLLDLKGLDKIESYNLLEEKSIQSKEFKFPEFILHILDQICSITITNDSNKIIFCDIRGNNELELIRISSRNRIMSMIGYHGIHETHYFKGKRMKDTPEWEEFLNRFRQNGNFQNYLAELKTSHIKFNDPQYYRELTSEQIEKASNDEGKLQKLFYWIFNDMEKQDFIATIYEMPNPFEIAYGKEYCWFHGYFS